jgi:hypothetical protein
MLRRLCAALLAALLLAAATACGGTRIFGKQYEYEEDLTLSLDGSATLVVNASLASLVALRGLSLPTDNSTRLKSDDIRALFASPIADVTRVSPAWRRKGRRFIQVRLKIADVRRLSEVAPFAWSKYSLTQEGGLHVFHQTVGASALRPGTLQNYGWDGSEIAAFRLHLPSKIIFHNARDLETNQPASYKRGNILAWEQHLSDRLAGRPVEILVRMESQSILYRTLYIFAGAFLAAVVVLILLVWWTVRKGKDSAHLAPGA